MDRMREKNRATEIEIRRLNRLATPKAVSEARKLERELQPDPDTVVENGDEYAALVERIASLVRRTNLGGVPNRDLARIACRLVETKFSVPVQFSPDHESGPAFQPPTILGWYRVWTEATVDAIAAEQIRWFLRGLLEGWGFSAALADRSPEAIEDTISAYEEKGRQGPPKEKPRTKSGRTRRQ